MTTPIEVIGPAHMMWQVRALYQIAEERARQDEKWGPNQEHPDGTGPMMPFDDNMTLGDAAEYFRALTESHAKAGKVTWIDILLEEVFEAAAESDLSRLHDELIQTAAVAVKWIEHIEARRERERGVW